MKISKFISKVENNFEKNFIFQIFRQSKMKFWKSFLFAASADLKPAQLSSDEDYLITNHDFESGKTGWLAPSLTIKRLVFESIILNLKFGLVFFIGFVENVNMNSKILPVMAKIPVEVNTQKSLNEPKIVRKQF